MSGVEVVHLPFIGSRICHHFGSPFGVLWEHFGSTLATLGSLLEYFGYIFCVKKRTGLPKVSQERPQAPTPEINSRFGRHFEVMFQIFSYFYVKKRVPEIYSFFCWILGRIECSTGRAHMQSVRACAVQTQFCIFRLVCKNALNLAPTAYQKSPKIT